MTDRSDLQAFESKKEKILDFDYLRTFIIILVVLHHAILAYVTFLKHNGNFLIADIIPFTNILNPIVDDVEWKGFDVILGLNDQFIMTLLFFISGFFIWNSYKRKGIKEFFRQRFIRLGIPFIIGIPTIPSLSYYSAHLQWGLQSNNSLSFFEFWLKLAKGGFFLSGPLWFLWVLFAFNCITVLFFRPGIEKRIKSLNILNKPILLFISIVLISTIVYLPLSAIFGWAWIGIGPFVVQGARVLHYFMFFLIGSFIGMYGIEKSLFRKESQLSKFWWIWFAIGLISFPFFFPLSCTALVFCSIGFFRRYTKKNIPIIDSLNNNAFGIYIFHYAFTSWLQYVLLGFNLSAIVKGLLVFTGALIFSWGFSSLIRKIPVIARTM